MSPNGTVWWLITLPGIQQVQGSNPGQETVHPEAYAVHEQNQLGSITKNWSLSFGVLYEM